MRGKNAAQAVPMLLLWATQSPQGSLAYQRVMTLSVKPLAATRTCCYAVPQRKERGMALPQKSATILASPATRELHASPLLNQSSLSYLDSAEPAVINGDITAQVVSLPDEQKTSPSPIAETSTAKKPSFPTVLWRFTRPHTLIGSALAIPSLHLLAAPTLRAAFTLPVLTSIAFCMVPSLLMNLYITGLNQVTDVEIDKINKPNLPIAAGHLAPSTATVTVLISLALSLGIGMFHPVLSSQGLYVALGGSMILGTMYSLPPFRLKRFPLLAAFCVVAVRGTIINAGFFAHAQAVAFSGQGSSVLSCLRNNPKCALSSLFFAIFGIVIALMKDVPDVTGDALSNIRSFSVRIGQTTVFNTSRRLLQLLFVAFGGGFLRGSIMSPTWGLRVGRLLVGLSSLAAAWNVRREAVHVNPEDSGQVYEYYMHLWKLFYLSYLFLPFAR